MTQTPDASSPDSGVVTVTRNDDQGRYDVTVDGDLAGFTEFFDDGDQRVFFHTEIDDAFGGRGLAGTLVQQALDATREDGQRIVPVCPYVAKYVKKHDTWADIVDRVTPDALQKSGEEAKRRKG